MTTPRPTNENPSVAKHVVRVPETVFHAISDLMDDLADRIVTKLEAKERFQDLLLPYTDHPPEPGDHTDIVIDRPEQVSVPVTVH